MNAVEPLVRRVDGFQQGHRRLAIGFGVIKKFGDDRAGTLALPCPDAGLRPDRRPGARGGCRGCGLVGPPGLGGYLVGHQLRRPGLATLQPAASPVGVPAAAEQQDQDHDDEDEGEHDRFVPPCVTRQTR